MLLKQAEAGAHDLASIAVVAFVDPLADELGLLFRKAYVLGRHDASITDLATVAKSESERIGLGVNPLDQAGIRADPPELAVVVDGAEDGPIGEG